MLHSRKKRIAPGNGKRHRTPLPAGLRKIKRVSFKVFLSLKNLFNSVKGYDSITPRRYRKKLILRREKPRVTVQQHYVYEYEPSSAINVRDSQPWRWRRVNEWHRYLDDPVEKIKGHMIT